MNDLLLYELQQKISTIHDTMMEIKKKNSEYNTSHISDIYTIQNDIITIQNTLIGITNEINHLQPPYKSWCTYISDHIVMIVSFLFMYSTIIYILVRK
jgi:uncharacterized Zn-finger protein